MNCDTSRATLSAFQHFDVHVNSSGSQKKQLECTWVCTGISPLPLALRTWLKCQKMW